MEVATALGTQIALSALSSVVNKLGTYLGGDVTLAEMNRLKLFLLSEISVFTDEIVESRPLLEELQKAALEVDDLLDLYEYNQIEKQVSSSSTNFIKKLIPMLKAKFAFILPKSSLKVRLENLLDLVHQVEEKYPFIRSGKTKDEHTRPKYKIPDETTSTLSSPYFGRDVQYETIVKLLLDESHADSDRRINEVPVIAIKGIGGSGKSLTAQLVCKDKRITDYFDKSVWVHVTADFDVKKLTKKIIESLNNGECPTATNLDALQTSLKEVVKKRKRILFVLDDVWCEDKTQWDRLVGPLNEVAEKGSKIIITTRLTQLARSHAGKENVIALDELADDDCWSILKYYAFNDSKHVIKDPELVNVGNQIITKARSSPLALKVVGSSLRDIRSVNEWENFTTRDILMETMDLLSFSFQRLPSHLQRCFAYCSLFHKGYILDEDMLVSLWIAQGYIENTNDNLTLEEKGSIYIADLLSYSFFENDNFENDNFENDNFVNGFIIHDLLHDLAERVTCKLCHRVENSDSLMNIPPECIHLSMYCTKDFTTIEISDMSKLSNLRSLIILDDVSRTNIFRDNANISEILSKLRAIHVEDDKNMEVLSNLHIDQLKHLRYLHLHYGKKLLESLTKLYHLRFLILHVDFDVIEGPIYLENWLKPNILPQGFGNLINLRTLKFLHLYKEVDYLKCNMKVINIEKLKSLQSVAAFHPEKDNVNGMIPLKNLHLRGSLKLCSLENVKSKEDAEKALLKEKKNLNELVLEWTSIGADGDNDLEACERVLEGLEPHQNLKTLGVKGYQGVTIANWLVKKSFPLSLHKLVLLNCKNIREIDCLPPGLQKLDVESCRKLTKLPSFGSNLKSLRLIDCLMLTQLPPFGGILDYLGLFNCPMLTQLPPFGDKLRELTLDRCPMLTQLPPFGGTLRQLTLKDCPMLTQLPPFGDTLEYLTLWDCPLLRRLQSMPNNSPSLKFLSVGNCPMLMDEEQSLVMEEGIEREIVNCFSKAEFIVTDEPLLVLALVQRQAFRFITSLGLYCTEGKTFPPVVVEHFPKFSALETLCLEGFKTLSNLDLDKHPSLKELYIGRSPDVELLPKLNISLRRIMILGCHKLKANYNKEDGPLYKTISHIPDVRT